MDLYAMHRHVFAVSEEDIPGESLKLNGDQKETVGTVIDACGKLDAYQLSTLTHTETPWADARGGIPSSARSTSVISLDAMEEYYVNLVDAAQA